jgi:NAD(P)-dependent dehydrogenase (short-subunit alcohol dehydrogenase family)
MDLQLKDRAVIVTGGAAGIGGAISRVPGRSPT